MKRKGLLLLLLLLSLLCAGCEHFTDRDRGCYPPPPWPLQNCR